MGQASDMVPPHTVVDSLIPSPALHRLRCPSNYNGTTRLRIICQRTRRTKRNGTERDGRRRFHLSMCGSMGLTERTGSARNSRWIRPDVGCVRRRIGDTEQGEERLRKASAAPVSAPVTADTRRHSAALDDTDNGADRNVAMACDTPRHAGRGLQNRRVQVRFLSHLPLKKLELERVRAN